MLTFQGWFILQAHWLEEREGDYNMTEVGRKIRTDAEGLNKYHNVFVTVKSLNGTDTILIAGAANRKRGEHCEILEFVKSLSTLAPGTYGILHFIDGNEIDETYQCYVLRKGNMVIEIEERFSPFNLKVGE